ncbi:galactose oxidase [Pleurotus eryngii]|uniref:Galactose oxidase n=1 Tax=Pleurotus eryngii TaxID=5323 RepID=A0A9P6D834_PLEER|nr:galactose oxidase [Pleurotus eryngii]
MAINLEKEQYKDDPEDCLEPSNVAIAQCLLNEWSFYNDRLQDLQGTLVPRHYGLWKCRTSWGGIVLFSILEWAGVSAYRLLRQDWKGTDTMDYRLACVSAIRDLHLRGIQHGQLVGLSGIRHILFDPDTKKARLIDFSHPKVGHNRFRTRRRGSVSYIQRKCPNTGQHESLSPGRRVQNDEERFECCTSNDQASPTNVITAATGEKLKLLREESDPELLRLGSRRNACGVPLVTPPTPLPSKNLSTPVPPPLSESPPRSPSPFPRYGHLVSASTVSHGDLYLFGGLVDGLLRNDLYLLCASFTDSNDGKSSNETDSLSISASLLETGGAVPSPRVNHAGAIVSSTLIIWGGKTNIDAEQTPETRPQSIIAPSSTSPSKPADDGLYLLNLVSREWTQVAVHGPTPSARYGHAAASIGASFFVFGGQANGLRSRAVWELHEPATEDRPAPRSGHSCVAHGDNIVIFGGMDGKYHYHDTWAFDTKTRTWTELQCIGYIPRQRAGHAASLVGDVMYVFGGRGAEGELGDAVALNITSTIPRTRAVGACDGVVGTKVVTLGGGSSTPTQGSEKSNVDAGADSTNVVHVLNTGRITYPPHHKAPLPHGNGNGDAF